MKTLFSFLVISFFGFVSKAQNAISFDSLSLQASFMTDDAIYFNSDKLVKTEYNGNVIWAVAGAPANSRLKVYDNYIYIYTYSGLTRLDSNGIILWSQDFNQAVCSLSSVPNVISDVVVNLNRIFILTNQAYQGTGFAYPSVITLDTNGTIINTWCGNDYRDVTFQRGVKKNSGGAWIAGDDGGAVHTGMSINIDLNGLIPQYSNSNTFQRGQFNTIDATLTKSNGDHVFFINSFTPGYAGLPYLVIESDNGTILAYRGYSSLLSNLGMNLITACHDQFDNLYILGRGENGEAILFKTNEDGILLLSKAWSTTALLNLQLSFPASSAITKMHFRNDSLYLTCNINNKASLISLDSNMLSSCFNPDLTSTIINYPGISINSWNPYSQNPHTYTSVPTLLQSQTAQQMNGNSVCRITDLPKVEHSNRVFIYPNPATDRMIVSSEHEISNLKICNLTGQFQDVSMEIDNGKTIINVSSLSNGIYMLSASISGELIKKSLVINH